jgi:hypothetical protein
MHLFDRIILYSKSIAEKELGVLFGAIIVEYFRIRRYRILRGEGKAMIRCPADFGPRGVIR